MPWPKGASPTPELTAKRLASRKRSGGNRVRPVIVDGMTYWPCPTCHRHLPESRFYSKKSRWNGLTNQCRECHSEGNIRTRDPVRARVAGRESMRRSRARDIEVFRARERSRIRPYDQKVAARQSLNRAVRSGRVVRPDSCSACGAYGRVTGHHPDYTKPLSVVWLCYICHANVHHPASVRDVT